MILGGNDAFGARPRVSGNSYANGANQNCGNVMSDVPSTRVAAPPGGKSSFSLAWDNTSPSSPEPQRGGRRQVPGSPNSQGFSLGHEGQGCGRQALSSPQGSGGYGSQAPQSYQAPNSPNRGSYAPQNYHSPQRDLGPPFGNDEVHGMRPKSSSNNYACGSNQNQGNVLTDVPTTRVLRPPGGGGSLNLGWGDSESSAPARGGGRARQEAPPMPQYQQQQPEYGRQGGQGGPEYGRQGGVSRQAGPRPGDQGYAFGQRQKDSSNSFANGNNQNCGNVLSDTPTTRVLRPPGGHSSLVLG
eukprot:TRINITY_DN43837_c0_g1_i1.p1 TRINITY_DN43837_c0_g1~~TRINITY_DN43837_c0_g1_i1.p1  ORF type:complete len:299 (+),score=32.53 TRINITY_DN43837_c0_g1_i1:77-973(+)